MQLDFGNSRFNIRRISARVCLTHACAILLVACICGSGAVQAQSGKLGAYVGTISVAGTQLGPPVTYRASVKVNLPITERDSTSATAQIFADEAPNATATISQWDISHKETSASADGKFVSWTCALAAPVEVVMKPTGVLNVDLAAKKYQLSLTLLSSKDDVAFNCVSSRTGPYKKKQGISLYVGTGPLSALYKSPQPFSDAARLVAKFTLAPTAELKGELGPITQEWDLRLVR